MQARARTNASRVGLLVIAFVVMLFYAWQFLGNRFANDEHIYFVTLADATGLVNGSKVLQSGVPIGAITAVGLTPTNLAKLTIRIHKPYFLAQGSTATIPSSLVGLGDNSLQIIAPPGRQIPLPDGSTIQGVKSNPLTAILPNAQNVIANLNKTLISFQKLLSDQKLKGSLVAVLQNSSNTMHQVQLLTLQTRELLGKNQESITLAVHEASLAMANIQRATDLAAKTIESGKFQDQTMALLKSLTKTSDKAQKLVEDVQSFVTDEALRKNIDTTMNNVAELSAQGKKIASNVNEMTESGQAAAKQAVTLTERATTVADEASKLIVKLQTLVDKVNGKVDKLGSLTKLGPVKTEVDLLHSDKPGYNRTDINFSLGISPHEEIDAGIYDAFESDRLNLQLGEWLNPKLKLRYGAYAGKLGLGVNYQVANRLTLVDNLFGLNHTENDLFAKYEIGHGFVGWLGVDRLFDRNQFSIGIGFEK